MDTFGAAFAEMMTGFERYSPGSKVPTIRLFGRAAQQLHRRETEDHRAIDLL
jgi:hypothetical protein